MKTSNRDNALERVRFVNQCLMGAVAFLFLLTLLFSGSTVYLALTKERTLMPPTFDSPMTVSRKSVSDSYLGEMAEYFINLKLNVTRENVARNYGHLLSYVGSSSYHIMQPLLLEEATQIKTQNISSTLFIGGIDIASDELAVRISGTLQKYVGSRALEPEPVSYLVSMSYPSGVLELDAIAKITKGKNE